MRARCAALLLVLAAPLGAETSTFPTITLDARGRLVLTQDAYLPEITLTHLGLSDPEDLALHGTLVYVADTGNRRVVIYDTATGRDRSLRHGEFLSPTGVWVTSGGELYVADPRAEKVFRFGPDLGLLSVYGRPTTPAYGESTTYKPRKVGVDRRGSVYIVGEGLGDGIILLSGGGDFLGFFASNKASMSLAERLQDLVLTDEAKEKLFPRLPPLFSSLHVIEDEGIVVTTSFRSLGYALKKHNVAGRDMLGPIVDVSRDPVDVYVDAAGTIYVAYQFGVISVFSGDGRYIFTFGSPADESDVAGRFTKLTGLAVDDRGRVWTTDGTKSFVQVLRPTRAALRTYEALRYYDHGEYQRSLEAWEDVLESNEMSNVAHEGLGRVYLIRQDYARAAAEFRIAGNRTEYAQAFWEVRNLWLERNLPWLLGALSVAASALWITGAVRRRARLRTGLRTEGAARPSRLPRSVALFGRVLGRPADAFQELKRTTEGTGALSAVAILAAYAVFLLDAGVRGYVFARDERLNLLLVTLAFGALVTLFVLGNYLVSSINDGTGTLGEVFRMTGYALTPFIVVLPVSVALTHVLTPNEVFLIRLSQGLALGWTFLTLSIGIAETHEYLYRDALKSFLITVFFMLIAVVSVTIVVVLANQALDLVLSIVREVSRRA